MFEGEAYVIQTVPDEPKSSIDNIKMEKIEEFFNPKKASRRSVCEQKKSISALLFQLLKKQNGSVTRKYFSMMHSISKQKINSTVRSWFGKHIKKTEWI